MKMQLLRWNNANPILGAQHPTSVFCGERGWTSRKSSRPPVAGEVFSLTSPYIEQASTLTTELLVKWRFFANNVGTPSRVTSRSWAVTLDRRRWIECRIFDLGLLHGIITVSTREADRRDRVSSTRLDPPHQQASLLVHSLIQC